MTIKQYMRKNKPSTIKGEGGGHGLPVPCEGDLVKTAFIFFNVITKQAFKSALVKAFNPVKLD